MNSYATRQMEAPPNCAQRDLKEEIVATVMTPKETAVCPFSGRMCKECAVYRGRHFELCASRNVRLRETRAAKANAWNDYRSTKWEMPEIPEGVKIIVDIENFVEKRDV
jgi:hypothetical protein